MAVTALTWPGADVAAGGHPRATVPFAHPHETRDSRFERFAEAAGNFTTRWLFFLIFLLLACAWVWAAATKHRDLEHVFIGIFTIASLFKIALLANSEKRDLEDLRLRVEDQQKALDALRDR